jgi:hypothetical protein
MENQTQNLLVAVPTVVTQVNKISDLQKVRVKIAPLNAKEDFHRTRTSRTHNLIERHDGLVRQRTGAFRCRSATPDCRLTEAAAWTASPADFPAAQFAPCPTAGTPYPSICDRCQRIALARVRDSFSRLSAVPTASERRTHQWPRQGLYGRGVPRSEIMLW